MPCDGPFSCAAQFIDDESLFGAFSILREQPDVIVVLRSMLQEQRGTGGTWQEREAETRAAMAALGLPDGNVGQLYGTGFTDDAPDWDRITGTLYELVPDYDHVYAPATYEAGGHLHHDRVGFIAEDLWGPDRTTRYHSYRDGAGRVTSFDPVAILDPDWIRLKLLALACYGSQIREPSTGHHFAAPLAEFYA